MSIERVMEHIDQIVYINLDRRTDRRAQIEAELRTMGCPPEKIRRFAAHPTQPGHIGCTQSHRDVIAMAKAAGWANVLILEDDFQCLVDKDTLQQHLSTVLGDPAVEWDVLFLSYNLQQSEDLTTAPASHLLGRTTNAQTASGYIVNQRIYDRLLDNLSRAADLCVLHPSIHWLYINDQYWKHLQADRSTTWLYFKTRLGKQRESYSDLSERVVDHGV